MLKIITNDTNLGLTKSLNIAAKEALGNYLARLDSNDYCLKERISKQFNFLETNKDYVLCGCEYKDHGFDASRPPASVSMLCFPGFLGS